VLIQEYLIKGNQTENPVETVENYPASSSR